MKVLLIDVGAEVCFIRNANLVVSDYLSLAEVQVIGVDLQIKKTQ
jgi:hypothetical protein